MAARTKKIAKKKGRLVSTLIFFATLAFLTYAIFTLVGLNSKLEKNRNQLNELKRQTIEQQDKNSELSRIIESDDKDDYIERIARERLGLVYSDEQVYYVIPED